MTGAPVQQFCPAVIRVCGTDFAAILEDCCEED